MKITIYTINDCEFSKQEKEYLASYNLPFEEKNLETNREYLTEMLAVGNNFAGTPVTKIEKDDGSSSVLKGFTKEEFDRELGFASEPAGVEPAVVASAQAPEPPAPANQPTTPPPAEPQVPPPPVIEPPTPAVVPPAEPVVPSPSAAPQVTDVPVVPPAPMMNDAASAPTPMQATPANPATAALPSNDELNGILNNLQSMAGSYQAPPQQTAPAAQPVTPVMTAPAANNSVAPSIPDPNFSDKT